MTLVELMVAMLVGLLITLAAVSALIAARRGFASVDAASQLRDNARFATEFIRRLAVQSGYKDLLYATTKRGSSIGISVDPLPNVFGFDNALASKNSLDAGIARPNGTYGDVLVLRFQDTESLPGSNTADGSMIDCAGFSNDGALPADRNRDSTRTSVLFVNTSNDGEPTLMCYRSSTGSLPFDNARPMIRGVENFQVLYGVDGVTPKTKINPKTDIADSVPDRYLSADQLTVDADTQATQANWRRVRSLRIGMVLRSDPGPGVESKSQTLHPLGAAFGTAADQGTVFTSPADNRLRQVVTFTVHLRNDQGLGTDQEP